MNTIAWMFAASDTKHIRLDMSSHSKKRKAWSRRSLMSGAPHHDLRNVINHAVLLVPEAPGAGRWGRPLLSLSLSLLLSLNLSLSLCHVSPSHSLLYARLFFSFLFLKTPAPLYPPPQPPLMASTAQSNYWGPYLDEWSDYAWPRALCVCRVPGSETPTTPSLPSP